MQQELVVMRGNKWILFLTVLCFLCLSACIRQEDFRSSKDEGQERNFISFKEVPASELLGSSSVIPYPNDFSFVPTFLGDDGFAYGYSIDEENHKTSLIYLDTKSKEYGTLKTVDIATNPVTFGTYFADEEFAIFNEYRYENQTSAYYLWNKKTGSAAEILNIPEVSPLHFSEIKRWKNHFIIVTSDSDGNYPVISYDIKTNEVNVIEEQNSGYPVIVKDSLYYIILDNEYLETKLVRYNLISKEKKILSQTTGSAHFYNGLCADKEKLILLSQSHQEMVFQEGYGDDSVDLFKTDYAETINCHNGFLSFIGTNNRSGEGRMQSYLYNLHKKVIYKYEDSVLYLSDSGILWVEYLKPESEIDNGDIFNGKNSRIRYLAFDKKRGD